MNLKYEVGQKVPVIHSTPVAQTETILNISVGKKGAKYGTSSGAYTEAEIDAFTANSMNKPPEDKPFDWNAFRNCKVAVNCDTEKKAKEFVQKCRKHLPKRATELWEQGETNWRIYGKDTCYISDSWHGDEMLCYSSKSDFRKKGYTIIDYPFSEQPTEQKEPIKLYCVKDMHSFGENACKGDVCTFDPSVGALELPNGTKLGRDTPRSYDEWESANYDRAESLVPLVKRPAKVGEYIVPMVVAGYAKHDGRYDQYDLLKVTQDDSNIIDQWIGKAVGFENITHPDRQWHNCVICHDDYLVLDGYQPEPEAEFVPYLKSPFGNYGNVGDETPYTDVNGEQLFIGDVVIAIETENGKIFSPSFVVKENLQYGGLPFVMGFKVACDARTGKISGFNVIKIKSYADLKNGEQYDCIEFKGEQEGN